VANPEAPEPVGDEVRPAEAKPAAIQLKSLELESDHGLMKDCAEKFGWKNVGDPCPEPEWTPKLQVPVSHTMDQNVEIRLHLAKSAAAATPAIRGDGPLGMAFPAQTQASPRRVSRVDLASDRRLEKKSRDLSSGSPRGACA